MRRTLLTAVALLAIGAPLAAQRGDTTRLPPGVSLATRYSKAGRPLLAVRPFAADAFVQGYADQVQTIVRNDLARSDRFEMVDAPSTLASGPVEYAQWNSLNVVYLVTADVRAGAGGNELALSVHDVVYGNVKQSRTFSLPPADAPGFRMAVHVVSDEIVRWITNQPGMAASRITFVRQNGGGSYDLLVVDSDGEDMRRILGSPQPIYSPVWSHDGSRVAYARDAGEGWELVERDMTAGSNRVLARGPLIQTPAYSADGKLVFAMWVDAGRAAGLELHQYDPSGGPIQRITTSAGDNLSPSFSPDGRQLAFHSSRTGRQHVYVMPSAGGNALLLSPLGDRAEYYAPDWSPTGNQVIFHGQSRDQFHLMLADASRPGAQITQLTSSGRNEDPSWAPDGRHIVFTGVGGGRAGLYVIDVITGEIRQLVNGPRLRMADWSPSLARGALLGNVP